MRGGKQGWTDEDVDFSPHKSLHAQHYIIYVKLFYCKWDQNPILIFMWMIVLSIESRVSPQLRHKLNHRAKRSHICRERNWNLNQAWILWLKSISMCDFSFTEFFYCFFAIKSDRSRGIGKLLHQPSITISSMLCFFNIYSCRDWRMTDTFGPAA